MTLVTVSSKCHNVCVCLCVSCEFTNAEDIEAEALADGLVDKLIWKAIKADMACQRQWPDSFILRKKPHKQTDHSTNAFLHKIR